MYGGNMMGILALLGDDAEDGVVRKEEGQKGGLWMW